MEVVGVESQISWMSWHKSLLPGFSLTCSSASTCCRSRITSTLSFNSSSSTVSTSFCRSNLHLETWEQVHGKFVSRRNNFPHSTSELILDEQTPSWLDPVFPSENTEFPRTLSQEKGVGTLTQHAAGAALVLHSSSHLLALSKRNQNILICKDKKTEICWLICSKRLAVWKSMHKKIFHCQGHQFRFHSIFLGIDIAGNRKETEQGRESTSVQVLIKILK